jgi:Domain of unknown function (DUF1996)
MALSRKLYKLVGCLRESICSHATNGFAQAGFDLMISVGHPLTSMPNRYYFNDNGAPDEKITAFPKGFIMISGDARQRNFTLPTPVPEKSFWKAEDMTQLALAQKSLGFNCLQYQTGAEEALTRFSLPEKSFIDTCYSGLRLEIQFPSCWNGKDIDSPNHKDHVKFPNLLKTGECPEGFNVRLPVLFYETIYAVADFVKYDGNYVLSNGDPTGYGYHGDFINGWDVDFLQEALDVCKGESPGEVENCPVFTNHIHRQAPDNCKFELPKKIAEEDCIGPFDALPGKVAIHPGPEYAPKPKSEPLDDTIDTPTPIVESSPTSAAITPAPESGTLGIYTTAYPIATSTLIENGQEVHLVIIQEDVIVPETVYVTVPPPMRKRHAHRHGRGGRLAA